jgi:hypothetical protein
MVPASVKVHIQAPEEEMALLVRLLERELQATSSWERLPGDPHEGASSSEQDHGLILRYDPHIFDFLLNVSANFLGGLASGAAIAALDKFIKARKSKLPNTTVVPPGSDTKE